jgi:pimeloyl-ACP methyl ester carboxylesterase
MANVEYSPKKVDLFFPARRGNFFSNILSDKYEAVCAEMARLAYCREEPAFGFDRDQITGILKSQGFTAAQFFESRGTPDGRGTHCFLASDPARKLAIVSFRGTDASDPTDLCHDAYAFQIPWSRGGRVHAGFAHGLAQVQDDLLAAIDALNYESFYTGHSLGAAMATLLASLRKPDYLYTIGSPRVGDNDFVNTLANVSVRRFVDCCDIVTRVPPENLSLIAPYKHFGSPSFIDRDRNLQENPTDAFMLDDRLHASADYILKYSWVSGNVAVRELADHAPINYVEALKC